MFYGNGFEIEREKIIFHYERINYIFYMQNDKILKINLYLIVETGILFIFK